MEDDDREAFNARYREALRKAALKRRAKLPPEAAKLQEENFALIAQAITNGELDATQQETEESKDQVDPPEKPFDIARDRERVRRLIVTSLLAILAIFLLFTFISVWLVMYGGKDGGLTKEIVVIFVAPFFGVLGTALGFYFASEAKK